MKIRDELLSVDASNTGAGLRIACKVGGLGPAGASGLLALMYPQDFGTVDVFLLAALSNVRSLAEADEICRLEARRMRAADRRSSFALSQGDAVMLIEVMRRQAAALNSRFSTDQWTPRKVDKVLWTSGH